MCVPFVQSGAESGEQTERDTLIGSHVDRLFAFLYRRIGRHHDAEDLTNDTLTLVMAKWHHYDSSRPFWPWLVTVAKRHLATLARSGKLASRLSLDENPDTADSCDSGDVTPTLDALILHEDHARLRAAIDRLASRQREAILMYYFESFSANEIADIEQVPVGTVYRRLHDARTRLAEALGESMPSV
jgi:RNA polymerase sigma-70 factor (ECF subfamily)